MIFGTYTILNFYILKQPDNDVLIPNICR